MVMAAAAAAAASSSSSCPPPLLLLLPWMQGIITKGSSNQHNYYIKSYQVLSSRDGKNWKVYKASDGNEEKIFEGNNDSHQEVSNAFIPPVLARYLRIVPQSWNQKVALKVALLGCQADRQKAPRPYSDSGIHSGPNELPILTSSPAVLTQIPGIVVNSEKTGPPLLVMLLIGGFVLTCSALLLLVFLCHKKRKATVDQDCGLIKEANQVCPGGRLHLSTSEIASFHGAGMPGDVGRTQSPEYAEPDMVQVSPSSQTAPSTFKPALDEGYTVPMVLNHYDVPSKYHEYAEPLPPEPEYATPFIEQTTEPEGDSCRKNISVIKAIPSSKSLGECPALPGCMEIQLQYGSPVPRPAEKLDSKMVEVDLKKGSIQTGSTYEDPCSEQALRLRAESQAAQPATSSQGHSFKHIDSPIAHIYHEPL